MASDLKTQRNQKSVQRFLEGVPHEGRREDARKLVSMMEEITGESAQMWGDSIVGFGSYHYVYESGREGDWMLVGFSPRKSNLVLYIMSGFSHYEELLSKLGKHKTGKSCLYLGRLADVDEKVLRRLVRESVAHVKRREREQNNKR